MSNSLTIALILLLYFAVLMLVSFFTSRKADNDTFFRASRRSPWMVVAFGMIGASISGISFVSVPGMVQQQGFTYLQMCIGFFVGYVVIAQLLLPLYYRRNYTSIYTFLDERFGATTHRTGTVVFLIGKLISAATRLYLVCLVLHHLIFKAWGIPFVLTALCVVLLVWLYTHSGGIRTIVWTDAIQTLCLLTALIWMFTHVLNSLDMNIEQFWEQITQRGYTRCFIWEDWNSPQHFIKQFLSGAFITIVMTGLDQDTMQKNLTCRNLNEAKKNMYSYGITFLPVNFLFLLLGAALLLWAEMNTLTIPTEGDQLLLKMVTSGGLGRGILIYFAIGIVAAAFSSADSAMTALTTGVCVDLLNIQHSDSTKAIKLRRYTHAAVAMSVFLFICLLSLSTSGTLLDTLYMLVSYTYGPLLGLYAFGICTKLQIKETLTPYICITSPILCAILSFLLEKYLHYQMGYELLLLNGFLTFLALTLSKPEQHTKGTSCS